MIRIHNGQATAQLVGFGFILRTLHYVSLIATSTEVKSFKASLIQCKSHSADGYGTFKRDKDHHWQDFKVAIPGTPFLHYVFTSLDINSLLLINPPAAITFTDEWKTLEYAERVKRQKEWETWRDQLAPALLRRSLNDHSNLPIPPEWENEIYKAGKRKGLINEGSATGDCAWLASRSTDEKLWHAAIAPLLLNGSIC